MYIYTNVSTYAYDFRLEQINKALCVTIAWNGECRRDFMWASIWSSQI